VSHPSSEASAAPAAPLPEPAAQPRARAWRFGRALNARVGARQLELELIAGGRHPRRLAVHVHAYADAEHSAERSFPTELAQALAGLAPALAELQARMQSEGLGALRGVECRVVIDDSWMLYDVVRADLRGLAPHAADSLISASLADVAGVDATELASRWQAQGKSAYTLACGLPANALPVLHEALRAHGMVAGSIEGEFVGAYNRVRDRLDPKCAVIALIRDAGAQLGIVIDGIVTAMSFEFGVASPKELELRGRGLLRVAGVGGDGAVRFYALSPPNGPTTEPWVDLPAATAHWGSGTMQLQANSSRARERADG
jgi:hypothetical protein